MKKITSLLAIMAVLWSGVANAANWYVSNNTSGGITGVDATTPVGTGTSASTPFLTITYAISQASSGDVINIAAGTYTESNLMNGVVNKSLTFKGAGKTTTIIQGFASAYGTTTTNPIFNLGNTLTADETVTIQDLTIQNGSKNGSGGAIVAVPGTSYTLTLNMTNVILKNNWTSTTSTANGGALRIEGRTIATLTSCELSGNKLKAAAGGGGAILFTPGHASTSLSIVSCYIHDNIGGSAGGGVIYTNAPAYPLNISIENSTISANTTTGNGGAFMIIAGNTSSSHAITIKNSTFYANTVTGAAKLGAAIYFSSSTTASITPTQTITLNHATIANNTTVSGTGGDGICINSAGLYNTTVVMNNSIVIGNSGSTSNQSQIGTNAASQNVITNGGVTNSILGGATTAGTSGIVGTWIDAATTHNNITAGINQLAFVGSLSADATPVLKFGAASIARNYVTSNAVSSITTDELGATRSIGGQNPDVGAWEYPLAYYAIAASAGTGGTITSGTGNYDDQASCTLVAAPTTGYAFDKWTEGGLDVAGAGASYTFTVSASRTLVANFVATATPSKSVSVSTLTGLNYALGAGPSAEKSFTITGTNLTNSISVTPSTNYEISTGTGVSFAATSPITISKDRDGTGAVTAAPIYVRLKSGLTTGNYNGEAITVSSTDTGSDLSVTCSGVVSVSAPTSHATTALTSNILHTTATLNWTAGDGAKYLVLYSANSDVATAHVPVNGTTYTVGSTTASGYIVGYVGSATTASLTSLPSGTALNFAVFSFNDNGTPGLESYLVGSPATTSATTIVASATTDFFRTTTNGDWSTASIWESSANGSTGWHLADIVPSTSAQLAEISNGNTVTITTDIVRSGLSMATGSKVVLNTGADFSKSISGTGTITIEAASNKRYSSTITGASTVNVILDNAGSYVTSEWTSEFKCTMPSNAQVNVTTSLTPPATAGYAVNSSVITNAKVNLGEHIRLIGFYNQNLTPAIGELTGVASSTLENVPSNTNTVTYNIGGLNTTATFDGTIANMTGFSGALNINKVGTGNWTLTGSSSLYTSGAFNVNVGTLTLNGSLGGSSVPVTVASGATLTGSGTIAGATTVNGTIAGSLNFNSNVTLSSTALVTAGTNIKMAAGTTLTVASGTAALDAVTINTNGSTTGVIALPDNATIPNLTITATSAPAKGATMQVISATTPGSIVYNNIPVVPAGYSFNTTTGVLTYNGNDVSSSLNTSDISLPFTNATLNVAGGNELTVNGSGTVVYTKVILAAGAKLTVPATKSLTSAIELNSDPSGTATFVNKGTATVASAKVYQYLPSARNWYITPPITGATVPTGATYFYYDETQTVLDATTQAIDVDHWIPLTAGSALTQGVGYIAQPGASATLAYSGTLNDGNVPVTLTRSNVASKAGFNLVGNPYPSYLDWKACYQDATNTTNANVDPTIWYRTKNSTGTYKFGTYGAVSNTGTNIEDNANPVDVMTGNIPPMQAFWVRVNQGQSGGTLTFKNSMRAHKGSQLQADTYTYNDAILRAPSAKSAVSQVLRLQVSNGTNSDEAIVLFNDNASNGLDAYDSPKMTNNSASIPEIYTTVSAEALAINGLNSIPYDTEMPVGFTTLTTGTFSIKASQLSNFDAGTQVILKDYQNTVPVLADLSDGSSYSFSSGATTNNTTRFTLTFRAPSLTTAGINPASNSDAWISTNANKELIINANPQNGTSVEVINAIGQKIVSKNLNTSRSAIALPTGVYMVSLSQSGQKMTQKVVIH